jgi:oligopeptide transport system substrate-binding protein
MNDPAQAARVVVGGQLHTGYVTMNVTPPPFDNVKVRQAVNMAINKDRIVQIINGRACPRLPGTASLDAGLQSREQWAMPMIPKARRLLAEAGVGRDHDRALRDEHRPQPEAPRR